MGENYWEPEVNEADKLRMGSSYPPVKFYISAIDIAKLNSKDSLVKTIILSDGKEVDLEIYLETDKDIFTKELREAIKDDS